jgi:hypothetical protein
VKAVLMNDYYLDRNTEKAPQKWNDIGSSVVDIFGLLVGGLVKDIQLPTKWDACGHGLADSRAAGIS